MKHFPPPQRMSDSEKAEVNKLIAKIVAVTDRHGHR